METRQEKVRVAMKQLGFFDESNRLKKLSQLGDSAEMLDKVINWEMFRGILGKAFCKEPKEVGGCLLYDCALLFKILVFQRIYNISDDRTEYQINDRMSFLRFLGSGLGDSVPDAKTIWLCWHTLTKVDVIHEIFQLFNRQLENAYLITYIGSTVAAPWQRNTRDENAKVKVNEIPEEWKKFKNAHKLAQKDTDAQWTKKDNDVHCDYKDHVKADVDSKFITKYAVMPASVHNNHDLLDLLDETDKALHADSAYFDASITDAFLINATSYIHEQAYRGSLLTEKQKDRNRITSRIHARTEHVFGFVTVAMHGITVRSITYTDMKFSTGQEGCGIIASVFRRAPEIGTL